MNIALIGYRASGKTTISKSLQEAIGWECFNTDKTVEKIFKMKIPEIVKQYGWDVFREYEKKVINRLSGLDGVILDLGGGAVTNPENIRYIKKNSVIIFLDCSPAILAARLEKSYFRPPLTNLSREDEIRTVLNERMGLYNKCSDLIINTGKRSPEETVFYIIKKLVQKRDWNFQYNYTKRNYAFA